MTSIQSNCLYPPHGLLGGRKGEHMDEVFVVTGGGSGIGCAVAEALPKEATVIITGRTLA